MSSSKDQRRFRDSAETLDYLSRTLKKFKRAGRNKQGGDQYSFLCPLHDDRSPSGTLGHDPHRSRLGDWILLPGCKAGCIPETGERKAAVQRFCDAVGIDFSDLFDPTMDAGTTAQVEKKRGRLIANHEYYDEEGVCRYIRRRWKGGRSKCTLAHYGEQGEIIDKLPSDHRWLLYHLPELRQANPEEWVLLVEGEKDVETAEALGFVATTHGGSGNWKDAFISEFESRRMVIIPDSSEAASLKTSIGIAEKLTGVAKQVKLLRFELEDVSEVVEGGGTREDLIRHIEATPDFKDTEPFHKCSSCGQSIIGRLFGLPPCWLCGKELRVSAGAEWEDTDSPTTRADLTADAMDILRNSIAPVPFEKLRRRLRCATARLKEAMNAAEAKGWVTKIKGRPHNPGGYVVAPEIARNAPLRPRPLTEGARPSPGPEMSRVANSREMRTASVLECRGCGGTMGKDVARYRGLANIEDPICDVCWAILTAPYPVYPSSTVDH